MTAYNHHDFWTCVYFIQASSKPYLVKIGQSKAPRERLEAMMTGCPTPLILVWYMRTHVLGEQLMHEAFADQRVRGEWFFPHEKLKGFVNHCKREDLKILTPSVVEEVLPQYATVPQNLPESRGTYRTLFDSEYWEFIQSRKKRPVRLAQRVSGSV